nr:N-acyl homoserine lactonase family protein [Leucobacter chromiireducens]
MDYYLWLLRNGQETIVVDTGAKTETLTRRGRTPLLDIAATLLEVGVSTGQVEDVILTHLHYDHAGGIDLFPAAQFHLQSSEWAFVNGGAMQHSLISGPYESADIEIVRALIGTERIRLYQGDHQLRPGIELRHVGGHTEGTQIVRVRTARGWLVLASDAMHFRANADQRSPFPVVADVIANLDSHQLCIALADADELVIPGHDPETVRKIEPDPAHPQVFQLA